MTESSKRKSLPGGDAVMLRGRREKAVGFAPKSLSLALAQAFSGAASSLSQAITGLSITLAGLSSAHAQSQATLPQGGVAVHGGATFHQSGNTLNVNTTNGSGNTSVINWQSFNIGSGNTTNINQPSVGSSSINRVISNVPTQIHGNLNSNGRVIVVNQNGIAVGAGGVVDTAGFTASTLNISDADAKAGRMRFEGNSLSGGVQVDGVVRSRNGDVLLIAPHITTGKDALVKAENGSVILGAGQSVEVHGRGLEGVKFIIQGADNKVMNLGTLQGNAVGVFAGTLRHSGVIQAQTATMEGGKVVLRAIKDVEIVRDPTLANAPKIIADGGLNSQGAAQSGGNVRIESAQGNVTIGSGSSISASAGNLASNQQIAGVLPAGGAIQIVASEGRVISETGSQISATGHPGGTIRIFGGQESRIASIINASSPSLGAADAAGTLQLVTANNLGGTIQILSPGTVDLTTGAQLLASGDAGGGTILVGGDYQGANAAITNAHNTNISEGVLLEANARVNGNGGKVIVWADNDTHFSGTLHAKGGEQGGDGGFGETSGKKNLYFRGRADLSARRGRMGTLLLDPDEITIQGDTTIGTPSGSYIINYGGSGNFTVLESDLEAVTANVLLEANRYIEFQGTFKDNNLLVAGDLTLRTRNNDTDALSGSQGIYLSGAGNITIQAGGNVTMQAGTAYNAGVQIPTIFSASDHVIKAGTGNVLLQAAGSISLAAGINIQAGIDVVIESKKGAVEIGGFSQLDPASSVTALSGNIAISSYIDAVLGVSTQLTAANGSVTVSATNGDVYAGVNGSAAPGTSINAKGILLESKRVDGLVSIEEASSLTATGSGTAIAFIADRFALDSVSTSTTVVASAGSILIRPNDDTRQITIGTNTDSPGSGSLQMGQAEFDRLSAASGAIRFGDTGSFTGNISLGGLTAPFAFGFNPVALLTNGGSITQSKEVSANKLRMEAGSISLTMANQFYQLAAKTTSGAMSITTDGPNTFVTTVDGLSGLQSAGTINFSHTNSVSSNLYLDGGNISSQGDISIANFDTLSVYSGAQIIDSNVANTGNSGSITLGNAAIQGNTPGVLTLDTSTTLGMGGNVDQIGNVVVNTLSQHLGGLTVNTTAPSPANHGQIVLPSSVAVSGGNVSLNGRVFLLQDSSIDTFSSGQVILQGEVQGNKDLTINASGQVKLFGEMGTGTALNDISITSANGIDLTNRIKADGNLSIAANGSGSLNMTSAAEIEMTSALAPGTQSIHLFGQGGVQLGKITGTSAYNATVSVGTVGAVVSTASSALTNFSGVNALTLGGDANVGSAAAPLRVNNISGSFSAVIETTLHLENGAAAPLQLDHIDVNNGSNNAVVDIASGNNLVMAGPNEFNINGTAQAAVNLRTTKEFVNSTGINAGSAVGSVLVIAADERIFLDSDSSIRNFSHVALRGETPGRAITFVDSNTTGSAAGALSIGYGSLSRIFSSVDQVSVGNPDLSGGDILFDGFQSLDPFAGSRNYSFFSGGSISSNALRDAQLDQAGFKATGNINLSNLQLQGVNPIVAADSANGSIVIHADAASLTIGQVGPAGTPISGLKTQGVNQGINVTNLGGAIQVSNDINSAGQAALISQVDGISIGSGVTVSGVAVAGSASVLLKGTDVTINGIVDANGADVLLLPSGAGALDINVGTGAANGFSLTDGDFFNIANADTINLGNSVDRFRNVNVVGDANVGTANLRIFAGGTSANTTAVSQAGGTTITANLLFVDADDRSIDLNGFNAVDSFAANSSGATALIRFNNNQNLNIGVSGVNAIGSASTVTLSSSGGITNTNTSTIAAGSGVRLRAVTALGSNADVLRIQGTAPSPINLELELDVTASNTAGIYVRSLSDANLNVLTGGGINTVNVETVPGATLGLGASFIGNDHLTLTSGGGFDFGTKSISAESLTLTAAGGAITTSNSGAIDVIATNVVLAGRDGIGTAGQSIYAQADTFDLSVANVNAPAQQNKIYLRGAPLTGTVLQTSQFTLDNTNLSEFNLTAAPFVTQVWVDEDVGKNSSFNVNLFSPTAPIQLDVIGGMTFSGAGQFSLNSSVGIDVATDVTVTNTLTINGPSKILSSYTLAGNGTYNNSGHTLTVLDGGAISPGASPGKVGTLTIAGNLDLSGSSAASPSTRARVEFDLAAGANASDLLLVGGDLTFSGAAGPLVVMNEINAPSFVGGEKVTLMTAGGNAFGPTYGTTGFSDVTFNGNLDIGNKVFTADAIGIFNTWLTATPAGGDWYSNSAWSRGVAPNAYHDVIIDQSSPNLVTLSSGAAQIRSLRLGNGADANTLAINGGATLTFDNSLYQTGALVEIFGGSTLSVSGGSNLSLPGGTLNVSNGASLQLSGSSVSAVFLQNDGTVMGTGAINLGEGVFTNGATGTLMPGGANTVGTLSISATKVDLLSGSEVSVFVDTPSNYSKLDLNGAAVSLGGNLRMTSLSQLPAGNYVVIDGTATLSGSMTLLPVSGVSLGAAITGGGNNSYTVSATAAGAPTNTWLNLSGDWSDPSNWSLGRVPQAGDVVVINPAGVQTVTVSKDVSLGSYDLNFAGVDDSIVIVTGGSLNVYGGATLSGTLAVNGGALGFVGSNLNLGGTLNFGSGTITGNTNGGTINHLQWQGGTFNGAGTYTALSLDMSGGGSRVLDGIVLDHVGNASLGGGSLSLLSGALNLGGGSGTLTVANSGANLILDGAFLSAILANDGKVTINQSNLLLDNTLTQGGTFSLAPGAGLTFMNDVVLSANDPVVGGTFHVGLGNVVTATQALNRGTGSVTRVEGTLQVDGDFSSDMLFFDKSGAVLNGNAGTGSKVTVSQSFAATANAGFGAGIKALSITQASGDLTIDKDVALVGPAPDVYLSATGGDISAKFTHTGNTNFTGLFTDTGKTATISLAGTASQSNALISRGSYALDLNGNNLNWSDAGNSFGEGITFTNGGLVTVRSGAGVPLQISGSMQTLSAFGGDVILGSATAGLNVTNSGTALTVNASNSISQKGALSYVGSSDLTAVAGDISLGIASTYGAGVRLISGGSADINSLSALTLTQVSAQNFTAKSAGDISQTGSISVAGLTRLEAAAKNISLTNVNNNFGIVQVDDAAVVALTDTDSFTVNGKAASNAIFSFGSGITSTSFDTVNMDLTTSGKAANVNMNVTVSGGTNFNIQSTGDFNNITYKNASTTQGVHSPIVATGSVIMTHAGPMSLGVIKAATLDLTAGGDVTQIGALDVASVSVTAAGKDILLTDAGNKISNFNAVGNNVSLTTQFAVDPHIVAAGTVVLNAAGINQSAGNAISASALVANVSGGMGLFGTGNKLGSVTGSAGADIQIIDAGASLQLNGMQASGSGGINISSSGAVTQGSGQLVASKISMTGSALGSSSAMLQMDASGGVRFNATSGDAYVRNNNSNLHSLAGASAAGTLHYETTTGSGYQVTGNVNAANVELFSGGALQIGGASAAVLVSGSGSVLLKAMGITVGGATASSSSAVLSNGSLTINSIGDLNIIGGQAGAFSSLDATGAVNVNVIGGINITGGSGGGAYARLDPAGSTSMNITAGSGINLQGGAGNGAYAAIVSDGNITIAAPSLSLAAGGGLDADAVVVSNLGLIAAPSSCNGCLELSATPLGDGITSTGLYAAPPPPPVAAPVVDTNGVPAQLSQMASALADAQRDPEDRRDPEPEISVEGLNCP